MTTEFRTGEPKGQWCKEIEKESKGTQPAVPSEFVHACTEMKSLGAKPPVCPFTGVAAYHCSLFLCGVGTAERKRDLKGRNSYVYLSPVPTDRTEFCCVFIDTQTSCTHSTLGYRTHTHTDTNKIFFPDLQGVK